MMVAQADRGLETQASASGAGVLIVAAARTSCLAREEQRRRARREVAIAEASTGAMVVSLRGAVCVEPYRAVCARTHTATVAGDRVGSGLRKGGRMGQEWKPAP
jgi:hypothetical protein